MANICDTQYKVMGERKAVADLWNTLQTMEVNTKNVFGAPDKPCGRAVQMLTQKHVAKRYMIAKKVVPLHYESEWQYKYV